jgi:repressor LexA
MKTNLTPKQKNVLETIYSSINDSGYPPSLAELKELMGVASNQAVLNYLKSLEARGLIKKGDGQARSIKILPLGYQILGKEQMVPVSGISSAGPLIEAPEMFGKWVTLPGEVIKNEIIKQSEEEVFVIQVNGDSMINAGIIDGDLLLVKKTREYRSRDIVVARSDDGTTVKRFIAEPDGRAYLKPENPIYRIIPLFEETIFDGKVISNLSALNRINAI